jgi:hypothetical protein
LPGKVILLRPIGERSTEIETMAPFTNRMTSEGGRATAYVCSGFSCKSPTTDVVEMLKMLRT